MGARCGLVSLFIRFVRSLLRFGSCLLLGWLVLRDLIGNEWFDSLVLLQLLGLG